MKTYSFHVPCYVTDDNYIRHIESPQHLQELEDANYEIEDLYVEVPDDVVAQIIQDFQISLNK